MKQLLAGQETLFPHLYHSLKSAMLPFMSKSQVGTETRIGKRPKASALAAVAAAAEGEFDADSDAD